MLNLVRRKVTFMFI